MFVYILNFYLLTYCDHLYFVHISAINAIQAENGSYLAGQRILVKAAEMKSQKHKLPSSEQMDLAEDEPMNKSKYLY